MDIAECIASQISKTNMKSWIFSFNEYKVLSVKMTYFLRVSLKG